MKISYKFEFASGITNTLEVSTDADSPFPEIADEDSLPEWTRLEFHKCSNCPLSADTHARCPVAIQLVPIAQLFGDVPSFERTIVHVTMASRIVSASTDAQKALGSLLGLIMPLSGCPRLSPLSPMARFHLPLSTPEETMFRVAAMYLLSRYFDEGDASAKCITDLSGLNQIYAGIQLVNQGLAARLRKSAAFAELNSLAILDLYAQTMPHVIEDSLEDIRPFFRNGHSTGR